MDELDMDESDVRHHGGNVTDYRDHTEASDDEGDNADAESDGERALNL